MAAPIIQSVEVNPSTVQPGQAFTVTINAVDPDARTARLVALVTDAQGNPVQLEQLITIADPLSFELIDVDGEGFAIVQRASQPNVFDVVAPEL